MDARYAYIGTDAVRYFVEARLQATGFTLADSLNDADVVITHCASQSVLEDAYLDAGGIVAEAKPGALAIDLSPSTPSFARELEAVATVNGLRCVEAPLAVRDLGKADALSYPENLILFVSGEDDAVRAARPILDALSDDVRLVGGSGSAQLAKAAHSVRTVAELVAVIEADALMRHAGAQVSRNGAARGLRGDDARADSLLQAISDERFSGAYTIEMLMADVSAALMAAEDIDLVLPQAESCMRLLELMAVIGGAAKAPAALSLAYEEESVCAENGLDWSRAEQAFSSSSAQPGAGDDADYVLDMTDGFDDAFGEVDAFDEECDCDSCDGAGQNGRYPGFSLN